MRKRPSKFARWLYFYKEYKYFMVLCQILKKSTSTFKFDKTDLCICWNLLLASSDHAYRVMRGGNPMYSDGLLLYLMNNRAAHWLRKMINDALKPV